MSKRSFGFCALSFVLGLAVVLVAWNAQADGGKDKGPAVFPPEIAPPTPKDLPPLPGLPQGELKTVGIKKDDLPPILPPPVPPATVTPVVSREPIKSVWTFAFEVKDARMALTAKTGGKEFKILCDSVDMQAPRGQVTAQGHVLVKGADLEAKGDKLTIHFGNDNLILEGKVSVHCRSSSPQEVQLSGERFSIRHNETKAGKEEKRDAPDDKK